MNRPGPAKRASRLKMLLILTAPENGTKIIFSLAGGNVKAIGVLISHASPKGIAELDLKNLVISNQHSHERSVKPQVPPLRSG